MSLAIFKKKSVTLYGTNISGKGPFGFSLNGTIRNDTYIGKTSLMYGSGTPMRGQYPIGYGGLRGRYPTYIMFNVYPDSAIGSNSIRPYRAGLTNRGMLHTRYKCIYDGTYPGTIVKNVYTGDLTDNASQGNYVEKLSSDHICVNTNAEIPKKLLDSTQGISATDSETYIQYIKRKCVRFDTHLPKPQSIACV
jgi:hypothetical protein